MTADPSNSSGARDSLALSRAYAAASARAPAAPLGPSPSNAAPAARGSWGRPRQLLCMTTSATAAAAAAATQPQTALRTPIVWTDYADESKQYPSSILDQYIATLKSCLEDPQLQRRQHGSFRLPMSLCVLLRQHALSAVQAAQLMPLAELIVQEQLTPSWMQDNLSQLLNGHFVTLLDPLHQARAHELAAGVRLQCASDPWVQDSARSVARSASHHLAAPAHSAASHGIPAVVPRPAMQFGSAAANGGPRRYCGHCDRSFSTENNYLIHMHQHALPVGSKAPARNFPSDVASRTAYVHPPLASSFVPASVWRNQAPAKMPSVPIRRPAAPITGAGSSASEAICLDDEEPLPTAAQISAQQRLSLIEAKVFIAASFEADELVERMKLPLVDPLTLARIDIPVRSSKCDHVRCMDLQTILSQAERASLRQTQLACPICHGPISLTDLVVDEFLQQRLKEGESAYIVRSMCRKLVHCRLTRGILNDDVALSHCSLR
jgi:hypothetical protein